MEKAFCEFFAGIGLVREGLQHSGWSCDYANDIDPKKQEMYENRFGKDEGFHLGDVWETKSVTARLKRPPFLATASFPCIDLSLAGHWKGFEGSHSSTFFGFASVLQELGERRPRVVMLENVTGFITSKSGKDFQLAARTLADLGYWLDAFVVDAKYFVPQSRPRVFVVGVHESFHPPFMSRREQGDWFSGAWNRAMMTGGRNLRPPKLVELLERTELPTGWAAFTLQPPSSQRPSVDTVIDLSDDQDWWDESAVKKHHDMMSDRHRHVVDEMLASSGTFVGTIYRRKRHGKTRAEVRFDGVAGCLRTPKGGSARQIVIAIDRGIMRIRWMSPREYARLQGAGDFPLVENTIQNLFGFGDAVCVPVIRWIDSQVLTPLYMSYASASDGRPPRPPRTSTNGAGRQRPEHVA